MKNLKLLLLVALILVSCSTQESEYNTERMTLEQIRTDWRFYGFDIYYQQYRIDSALLSEFKTSFNPNNFKFLFFTSPACYTCGKLDSLIPFALRIIKEAGFSDSCFEIYHTPALNAHHPYETKLKLTAIPSAFSFDRNVKFYSIIDTYRIRKIDSASLKLENILIESVK
jgi:hypothetical protein